MKDKKEVKIKTVDIVELDFQNQVIKVVPYISLENKFILMNTYISSYFKDGDFISNYINAKYALILNIIDLCTDIRIEKSNPDDLVNSGLWNEIKSKIKNYDETMSDIYSVVKMISDKNAIDKSMGVAFDIFANKILSFVNNIDMSSEGISKLLDELQKKQEDFDSKYKG